MNKPKTRNENIVVQEMEKEILIYDLEINKAYCLNETSAMIWQLCDGKHSIEEISQQLSSQSKQPITKDLIWLALDGFKNDNLLGQSDQFEIDFNGLSRRQVIKKIGFASMVMLPVIASVIAPLAVEAQSGCRTVGQSCTGDDSVGNCCVGVGYCSGGVSCVACLPPGSPTCANSVGLCNAFAHRCCSGMRNFTGNSCPGATVDCPCA